jgi:SRSO17 transposase
MKNFADSEGMLTVDGSDFPKKGNNSAGVARQYCGQSGKVDNCQAGVFIGFSGKKGYGLLDAKLYIPQKWFEDSHKHLWKECDMARAKEEPQIVFQTKNEIAIDLINELNENNKLPFKWIGCDTSFGCDANFRASLPEGVYLFADVRNTGLVYRERPTWSVPPRTSKYGKAPSLPVPNVLPVPITDIIADDTVPWSEIVIAEGSKGPIRAKIKYCRVIECIDGKDGDECWLYIRQYENGDIRSSICNAPAEIDTSELNNAATLRWPIEQSFEECKSQLGMKDYETRSYVAWHRHMLLVMLAHLFVLEVRFSFLKKTMSESYALF